MLEKLKLYINDNMEVEKSTFFKKAMLFECETCMGTPFVEDYIDQNKDDESTFQKTLFKMIDDRNLVDADVYNKVHVDRRLFSKIRNEKDYHPSKDTVLLLGFSLELNEEEITQLLDSAAYTLPKNNYYDLIIRFCFKEGIYKISEVNDLLESYGQRLFNY